MDERVVERRVDVRDTEDKLALSNLGTERDGGFLLGDLDLLGGLAGHPFVSISIQPQTDLPRTQKADRCAPGHPVRRTHHFDGMGGSLGDGSWR